MADCYRYPDPIHGTRNPTYMDMVKTILDCNTSNYPFMVIFGVAEILLSQIPNFHELSWLSILAAVMSFGYASIGVGLSIAKIAEPGHHIKTSLTGQVVGVDVTSSEKIIVGLLGALSFFPLTVYFPIEMYLVQAKIPKYSPTWIGMKFLSVFCLLVSLVAAVGSVEGIITDLKTYKPF
ncbi:hypothetical protein TSUD_47530 [Trifolium subterraneum]|nr:hypothetical protein TSUD_47530 [Trifolium subterraneum]